MADVVVSSEARDLSRGRFTQGVSSTYPKFPYNLYVEFISKNCKRNLTKKFFSRKKMVKRAEKYGGNILKIVEEMINL